MVSYFYSSINYTVCHTGNTVPYTNEQFYWGHSAKISFYSGILYAKFFDYGVSRSSASTMYCTYLSKISLCSTTHEVWQTAKNESFRNFHMSRHIVLHRTSTMQHAHIVVSIPLFLSNCHAHSTSRMSFFLLLTLFTSSRSSTHAASLKVSTNRQTGTNSFTVVILAWCIIITPRDESFL
jgi:hypothetical protein